MEWNNLLRERRLFHDVPFHVYNSDGDQEELRGLYLICDGGFMKYRCLMAGMKWYSRIEECYWSTQMESTRKDAERAFGSLKNRFRCLKLPVLFHNQDDVDNMFWTCCILHNMIAVNDGRDRLWEEDIDWEHFGEHDVEDDEWRLTNVRIIHNRVLRKLTDYGLVGRRHFVNPVEEEKEPGFVELQRKLIDHYDYKRRFFPEQLEWLN